MKLLVFDGNSIINRAYYAVKNLTTKSGEPTGALHGFMKLYLKYFDMSKPDMVAVAFDVRAKTFRHEAYAEYKAQRKGMPDELALQMQPLKDILKAMNVCILEKAGYEADDIIGTLSRYCTENGYECDIVSGDRDDFQLVNNNVRVIMPVTRAGASEVELYGEKEILEKYGFAPPCIVDLKAIMGDASDNIKGVAGIGEKGATELIREYGTLENVYENIANIKPALAKKLEADKDNAFFSKFLATIKTDVPLDVTDADMLVKEYDADALSQILERYELSSVITALGVTPKKHYETEAPAITVTASEYRAYFEQNGLYFIIYNEKMYADIGNKAVCIEDYTDLLFDDKIEKTTYNAKPIYKELLKTKTDVTPFYDTEVAEYMLNPSESGYDIVNIIRTRLDAEIDKSSDTYAETVACRLRAVREKQTEAIISNGQKSLLFETEFPLTVVLADMENCGFTVDRDALMRFSDKLDENIKALESRIWLQAGEQFNINSPKQLGTVLFEKMGLPHGKKTKSGYSTGADILAKLSGKHEIIDEILEYRQCTKLKTTYCDGLLGLIGADGKIHTSFNQTVTQTGRISSAEPNLQNIPVRTELGRQMREMFISGEGNLLIDADYSQIELRVLAHIANDRAMLDAFANGEDVHSVTASRVFGVPMEFVTPEMRRTAKAVNFGIVYGISDFSLAQDIKTTKAQAKAYIESYLEQYSGVRDYMKNIVADAREKGYVTTLLNRRRYLPELASGNFIVRSFGERVALNTPIQGTAADIIKIAMVNTRNALINGGYKAKLIMQVHDELIIEAPDEEKDDIIALLTREMENAMKLNVRLKADVEWGRSWYECK